MAPPRSKLLGAIKDPIVGFRTFIVREAALTSVNGFVWSPHAWMRSACRVSDHVAPSSGCTCGFHAYYSASLHSRFLADEQDRLLVGSVLGSVISAGDLVLHDVGFRAATMRVLALVPEFPPELGEFLGLPEATARSLTDDGFVFKDSVDALVDHAAGHGRILDPDTDLLG